VKASARAGGRLIVTVRNPTRFEADLRIFSELDRERGHPLGRFPLWDARSVALAPGASQDLEFARPES
jgi:hypothetical protein